MTSGIFNVNKPRGVTSFSVVGIVRRLMGVRKVGHAGTLDPIADGVLPICVGRATRMVEHIISAPKAYHATVRLGEATDSYDSEGEIVATGDPSGVTREQIEALLPRFVGRIQQTPPMYSALKHQGQPLYRYARAGQTIEREARTVSVYSITLLSFDPPHVELACEVGRGAYVRTLAHDLGELLGCHAHLERLTRTRSGPFTVEDAIAVEELEEAAARGTLEALLQPADRVLESWYAALLSKQHAGDVAQGRLLVLEPVREEFDRLEIDTPCRAYSEAGDFLAILKYRGAGRWHPETVFAPQ